MNTQQASYFILNDTLERIHQSAEIMSYRFYLQRFWAGFYQYINALNTCIIIHIIAGFSSGNEEHEQEMTDDRWFTKNEDVYLLGFDPIKTLMIAKISWLNSFEVWFYRRFFCINWTERKTKE